MNKLISRNPVERFKLGRKIVKAQKGLRFVKAGNTTFNNTIWADSVTGDLYESNLDPNDPKNRVSLNTSSKNYLGKSTKVRNLLLGLFNPITINGSDYVRKTLKPRGTKTPYDLSPEAQKIIATKNAKLLNLRNQQKVINKESVVPVKKRTPNWKQNYDTFLGGLNTAQKNYLSREGVDYTNTEKLQEYLNSKGFGNRGTQSLDGKWGSRSLEAWNNFVSQTDFTPPKIEAPKGAPVVKPLPTYTTVPNANPTKVITQPLPTAKVFNRANTRDFIRKKGFGAYDFTGALRRALRKVLNGMGTDEDLAVVKAMGLFKKGGNLVSRNIVERFKLKIKK